MLLLSVVFAGGVRAQTITPPQSKIPIATPTPKPSVSPLPSKPSGETIDEDDVVRVTSNLVVVPVSVTNQKGEPIQGLKVADFQLNEAGHAQQIASVGDPDKVSLEIVLLLDVSASVDARFAFEKDAAARFLKTILRESDTATVYAIDTEPRLIQTRTTVAAATEKLLTIEPAKGKTAFYDTIIDAVRYLAMKTPAQHRRVIVAISDGEDTYSDRFKTAAATLPEMQRADTVFYSINPSGPSYHLNKISVRAQNGMEQIAGATGGTAFVTETIEDTEAAFRQIANELRAQYLLQYYSNADAPNGKFLSIKVGVPKLSEARIHARQGYYVKK
ncbi:MAG: hypothetical protein NVSMB56_05570 [Pyrinomonadaceae bacterium]